VTNETTLTVHGIDEMAARAAGFLGGATREFFCAAGDLDTWSRPGVRQVMASRMPVRHDDDGGGGGGGGPVVRKLFTPAVLAEEEQRLHLFELAAAGGQVRIRAGALPHEAIVIDRRVAILAGRRGPRGREFTFTTAPALVESVHTLMRASWETAVPFADTLRAGATDDLDPASHAVLRALADGLTDAAGARRVGLSLRTYRRRVADLMTTLHAGSRFQAGVAAGRLGLAGG
jgi:hypothetical protein